MMAAAYGDTQDDPIDPYLSLCSAMHDLWGACLVGNPAPSVKELRHWLENPRVGDLVIEITSYARQDTDRRRFGRLLKIVQDPIWDADDEEIDPADRAMTEDVWHIETHVGEIVIWRNCKFLRVPGQRSATAEINEQHLRQG